MIVSGSIFTDEMQIIPFANVVVLNENRSTSADANGKFTITANSENSQLRFSHAGYDYDTVSVAEFNKLGYIQLYSTQLDPVVIDNNIKTANNTWLWILGIFTAGAILIGSKSKKKAVNVTV